MSGSIPVVLEIRGLELPSSIEKFGKPDSFRVPHLIFIPQTKLLKLKDTFS